MVLTSQVQVEQQEQNHIHVRRIGIHPSDLAIQNINSILDDSLDTQSRLNALFHIIHNASDIALWLTQGNDHLKSRIMKLTEQLVYGFIHDKRIQLIIVSFLDACLHDEQHAMSFLTAGDVILLWQTCLAPERDLSNKVKVQVLVALNKTLNWIASESIFNWLQDQTSEASCPLVRQQCISILSQHFPFQKLHDIFVCALSDRDPRVRVEALSALLKEDHEFRYSSYSLAVALLKDENVEVRRKAMEWIWRQSLCHGSERISVEEEETIALVDDAFGRLCDSVNDLSPIVRTAACLYLGQCRGVDEKFLQQTLSKEIMSNMRRKKQTNSVNVYSDEFKLLDTGACGALIHALEDEFLSVRRAALLSLQRLGVDSASFSVAALEYILDMMHDEMDSVRLDAMESLLKLTSIHQIALIKEHWIIVLGVLEDSKSVIRYKAHHLIGQIKVATRECISSMLSALIKSLKRYPEDLKNILLAISLFAKRHALLLGCMDEFFPQRELRYLQQEPSVTDTTYLIHFVLLVNTANVSILSRLAKHYQRHFPLIFMRYPECFDENMASYFLTYPALTFPMSDKQKSNPWKSLFDKALLQLNQQFEAALKAGYFLENGFGSLSDRQLSLVVQLRVCAWMLMTPKWDYEALSSGVQRVTRLLRRNLTDPVQVWLGNVRVSLLKALDDTMRGHFDPLLHVQQCDWRLNESEPWPEALTAHILQPTDTHSERPFICHLHLPFALSVHLRLSSPQSPWMIRILFPDGNIQSRFISAADSWLDECQVQVTIPLLITQSWSSVASMTLEVGLVLSHWDQAQDKALCSFVSCSSVTIYVECKNLNGATKH